MIKGGESRKLATCENRRENKERRREEKVGEEEDQRRRRKRADDNVTSHQLTSGLGAAINARSWFAWTRSVGLRVRGTIKREGVKKEERGGRSEQLSE